MILSAGVIPVRQTNEGYRFLLLRVYRYWDFPKGQMEDGEAPFDSALREVAEETGISDLTFPWESAHYETAPYGRGKIARYYLGLTETETVVFGINPELGRAEHHEYRWVNADEARELLNDRVRRALNWALELLD